MKKSKSEKKSMDVDVEVGVSVVITHESVLRALREKLPSGFKVLPGYNKVIPSRRFRVRIISPMREMMTEEELMNIVDIVGTPGENEIVTGVRLADDAEVRRKASLKRMKRMREKREGDKDDTA